MKRGTIYKAIYTKEETYFVSSYVCRTFEGEEDYANGIEITFHDADDIEYCLNSKKAEELDNVELYKQVMTVDMDKILEDALAREIRNVMTPKTLKGKTGEKTGAGSTESDLEMRVSILERQKDELLSMVQNLQKSAEDLKNLELLPSDIEILEENIRWRITNILSWEGYGPFDDTVLRNLIKYKYHDRLKNEFGVTKISQIKHSDMERAVRVVDEFNPPRSR